MWNVISIAMPFLLIWVGWVYGTRIHKKSNYLSDDYVTQKMLESLLPPSNTVEGELARWREKYAHDEISLPQLEKTIEKVLQTGGRYGKRI